ncbi:tetratricopeptide repeat protein [Paraflavitalea pollutisoli]|uniref:tetratricopeptide repeat protein n=1 Tax=Paraflavitalea pollutisoli TaxID=3034143 RepID=UPI0023EE1A91|nr:tetratricopeptide repeat protein [Paraflavitalea sp. H1-2-19X]
MTFTKEDIPRYLDGDMSPDEEAAFEKALPDNPEWQELIALQQEVETGLQQHFGADETREQLKATMQPLRQAHFGGGNDQQPGEATKSGRVVPFRKYLSVAVAVAAVLIVGVWLWNPSSDKLYEKYAIAQMDSQTERGSHADSVLAAATIAFNSKDYVVAAVDLAEVVQQQPNNTYAAFYLGVALLHTDQLTQARVIFEKLIRGGSAFKYDATFYQALSFLKENDKETAKDWLEKIPADAPQYAKAQELMKKL